MIKAIIVEDEDITRNGLINHIPWDDLGIEVLKAAENAENALVLCEDFKPDIIISDIKMRGMNGVEMCAELKKRYPDAQIIYISAYTDKEYLKAAIEQGVVHYVEKPISPIELIDAVKRAAGRVLEIVEQRKLKNNYVMNLDGMKSKVLRSLLISDYSNDNLENDLLASGLFSSDKQGMRILILHSSAKIINFKRLKNELIHNLEHICGRYDITYFIDLLDITNIVVVLKGLEEDLSKDSSIAKEIQSYLSNVRFEGIDFFLAIGDLRRLPMELSKSYQMALIALKSLSFKGFGSYAYYDESINDCYFKLEEDYTSRLLRSLTNSDYEEVSNILDGLSTMLIESKTVLNPSVRNAYYNIDLCILHAEKSYMLNHHNGLEDTPELRSKQIESAETLVELNEYIKNHAMKVISNLKQEILYSSTIHQILEIIHKEYGDTNLSINTLAERVYLTPTYLAGLFKKETGKTIGQYLTGFRLEKAKQLLIEKQYKLYNIANLVGYCDANYFAKIFKRQFEITPSEYREKYKR